MNTINDDTNEHEYNLKQSFYYDDNEFITTLESFDNPVTIMTLNCCSLGAHTDVLQILIEKMLLRKQKIDILCLQETWLTETSDYNQFNIDGYNLFYQPAICSTHTGLITYVNSSLQVSQLNLRDSNQLWESLILQITLNNNKKSIVNNIYRPPREDNRNLSAFIEELTDLAICLNRYSCPIFLCGDININLIKMYEKRLYEEFFELLLLHSYLPNITLPTRLRSLTLIDNIFTNSMLYDSWSGVLLNNISDHQPCFTVLKLPSANNYVHSKFVRHPKLDHDLLRRDVNQNIENNTGGTMSESENYNGLIKLINDARNKQIDDKSKFRYDKYKHKKSNWITSGLIKSIEHRDGIYKQLVQTIAGSDEYNILKTNLTTFNRIINISKRALKKSYYANKFLEHK